MSESYHLATVPEGASIERQEDGSLFVFCRDGSAQRITIGIKDARPFGIVEKLPPITLKIGKA